MKKIVIERPGGYRRLQIKESHMPAPQDNEVLVEISAAGVNFADIFIRLGLYKSAREFVGWPITPDGLRALLVELKATNPPSEAA